MFSVETDFKLLLSPPLTTVAQPIEAIGRRAVSLILEQVENGKIERRENVLPVTLKIHETAKER